MKKIVVLLQSLYFRGIVLGFYSGGEGKEVGASQAVQELGRGISLPEIIHQLGQMFQC